MTYPYVDLARRMLDVEAELDCVRHDLGRMLRGEVLRIGHGAGPILADRCGMNTTRVSRLVRGSLEWDATQALTGAGISPRSFVVDVRSPGTGVGVRMVGLPFAPGEPEDPDVEMFGRCIRAAMATFIDGLEFVGHHLALVDRARVPGRALSEVVAAVRDACDGLVAARCSIERDCVVVSPRSEDMYLGLLDALATVPGVLARGDGRSTVYAYRVGPSLPDQVCVEAEFRLVRRGR